MVVEHTGLADGLIENPRLADGGRDPGNQVEQASARGNRIPAVDVPARVFK